MHYKITDVLPVMEPPALSPDDIPDDLKGEQKWSTVKISEKNVPSKSSIFGSMDEVGLTKILI